MQEARNPSLAGGRDDDFRAVAIHRIEIALLRYPHTRKTGKMIDLGDVAERLVHPVRIKYRTRDIFDLRNGADRRTKIKNPHLSTACSERRHEVLSDKAGAASDKYPGHECGSGST
jgi:hypothetical protein